jgi:simple sugar transport system permease protein
LIDGIPVVGSILSGQSIITWLALVLIPCVTWLMYRTHYGYRLRAIGEAQPAAEMVGIRPRVVQYSGLALSGALAGLGGVFLSMAAVSFFVRDMTAGRGFIALAAVYLGGTRPVGAAIAAIGFGAAEALSIQLGNFDVPSELITAIPYVLTLIALGVSAARGRPGVRRRSVRTTLPSGEPPV